MAQKSKKNRARRRQPEQPSAMSVAQAADVPGRGGAAVFVSLALVAAVLAVFGQTLRHGFVNIDDERYVTQNPHVLAGLTWQGLGWAFANFKAGFWHPLTWLSLMADAQFFGKNAAGFHFTSVALHAANAVLLFALQRRLTGALWRSAAVAALFALHPLHVECVAWVASRKDVLSTLFGLLALLFYTRHAQGTRRGFLRSPSWWLALVFFTCGLMSKTMVVTLPLVMLLLDWWPLRRFQLSTCILEKLPFLALALAGALLTVSAEKDVGALQDVGSFPLGLRAANAAVSGVRYLWEVVWPSGLAVFYPYPKSIPLVLALGSLLLLAGISFAAWCVRLRWPWLAVGWFWYVITLAPVCGLVQVGGHSHADRYTYISLIGIFVIVVWGLAELCGAWRHGRVVLGSTAALVLAGLGAGAFAQAAHWKDSITLWTHTLACTRGNFLGEYDLGNALMDQGRLDDAITHFTEALRLKPDLAMAHNNLGRALAGKGRLDEAVAHFREAVRLGSKNAGDNLKVALEDQAALKEQSAGPLSTRALQPDSAEANIALGKVMAAQGRFDDAIARFNKALAAEPENADTHCQLALALGKAGRPDEAAAHFREALRLRPDMAAATYGLGVILQNQRKPAEAAAQYRRTIKLQPESAGAMNNLAWILATDGTMNAAGADEAVRLAKRACELTQEKWPEALDTLAAAYAAAGRFDEALSTAQKAADVATAAHRPDLAREINSRMERYRKQAGAPPQPAKLKAP